MMNGRDQRAAHFDREVPARRRQTLAGIVIAEPVIIDIDAAHQCHLAVDHRHLAVSARDAALEPGVERPEAHVARGKGHAEPGRLLVPGTPPVGDHAHAHAALAGRDQRRFKRAPGIVVGKDVGFEVDVVLCGVNRRQQRRKERLAGFKQGDVVVSGVLNRAHRSSWLVARLRPA